MAGTLVDPARAGNLIVNGGRVGYQLGATMNAERQPAPPPVTISRAESWQVGLLLAAFFVFNLLTAARYPFVWIDEVMYSDPAVNLLLGHGFTSSAWYAQSSSELWAGNVPLHSAVLYLWLRVFDFSITSVRSLNLVYLVAAAALAWRAGARLRLIVTARARLTFLALLLGGYAVIFAYRSGRPDGLALLLVAALGFAQSLASAWQRIGSWFALGLLAPWVGLQLLPLLGVGGGLLLLFVGGRSLPQLAAGGAGAVAGLGSLVLFYQSHGVWESFLRSIRQHTSVGFFGMLMSGQFRHSNLLPKDFSFWPVFTLALLLAAYLLARRRLSWRSPLCFGLAYAVALSLALVIGGKFPTYYGWMTYAPLCLCVCAALSSTSLPPLWRRASGGALMLAVGVGAGPHLAAAAWDWPERDYERVRAFVRQHVTAGDWLYGDHVVYYAAKPLAARVFMPFYLAAMPEDEKRRLTVLLVAPGNLTEVTNTIGGHWVSTGDRLSPGRPPLFGTDWKRGFLSMPNHELEVFRRCEETTEAARP